MLYVMLFMHFLLPSFSLPQRLLASVFAFPYCSVLLPGCASFMWWLCLSGLCCNRETASEKWDSAAVQRYSFYRSQRKNTYKMRRSFYLLLFYWGSEISKCCNCYLKRELIQVWSQLSCKDQAHSFIFVKIVHPLLMKISLAVLLPLKLQLC